MAADISGQNHRYGASMNSKEAPWGSRCWGLTRQPRFRRYSTRKTMYICTIQTRRSARSAVLSRTRHDRTDDGGLQ